MNSDSLDVCLSPDGRLMMVVHSDQRIHLDRDEVLDLIEKINALIGAMPSNQNEN